jgi:hypothetical protein
MENLVLNLQSKNEITTYIADNYLIRYEAEIFNEMLNSIENGEQSQLDWFQSFGDSLRVIAMNVHAYRKGLQFGFTEIAFDKYGWFVRPQWMDVEQHAFGDTFRYGNHSTITIGHGPNGLWTYAMSFSFGCAGGGYALSVYDKKFNDRDQAFTAALNDLKLKMAAKVGSTDTTNDKQPIILGTLRDIEKAQIGMVQLTLF